MGDPRRFRNAKRVCSYAGLDPGFRGSAGKVKRLSISKEGSRLLRWALIETAWRLVNTYRRWHTVFEQLKRNTGSEKKAIVACAVEVVDEKRLGRVRLRQVADVSGEALRPFVQEAVEPGSSVLTDGWGGYSGLSGLGYDHMIINQSASPDPAHVLMPAVHRIAALLKRWLAGTYQGAVSREHLDYYLDEYAFRFNRRGSRSRGLLFYRLLQQAVQTEHSSTHAFFLGTGRGPDSAAAKALWESRRSPQDIGVG